MASERTSLLTPAGQSWWDPEVLRTGADTLLAWQNERAKLGAMLAQFRKAELAAKAEGVTFAEAMRLLAGAGVTDQDTARRADPDWSRVTAGPWLAETLRGLRSPEALARVDPGDSLRATLRPYQEVGVRWLHLLTTLGLGACLADDMGLGKTIQVLSLLLVRKRQGPDRGPSLLVAPASLLANWAAEIERFAPGLRSLVAHLILRRRRPRTSRAWTTSAWPRWIS